MRGCLFWLLIAANVQTSACKSKSKGESAVPAEASEVGPAELLGFAVRNVPGHARATDLWVEGDLFVGATRSFERAAVVRISVGDGEPVFEKLAVAAGVRGGEAYVARKIEQWYAGLRVGRDGETAEVGRFPLGFIPARVVLTNSGEMVASRYSPMGAPEIVAIGRKGVRRIKAGLKDGDTVYSLAADRTRPRLAIAISRPAGPLTLAIYDTDSLSEVAQHDLDGNRAASDGHLGFDDKGDVWIRRGEVFEAYGIEGRTKQVKLGYLHNVRTLVYAGDMSALAFTSKYGGGHGQLHHACKIHVVKLVAGAEPQVARNFDTDCYFGRGIRFVGTTLWVSGPAEAEKH